MPQDNSTTRRGGRISAAPFGSASILPITWMYIRMMGYSGLRQATEVAILNANYIAKRLKSKYSILFTGANDRVAHECIVDTRDIKEQTGISVDDIAKRLIDYGFHAPTMSFPVAGTLMIEPTESESKREIDRFCDLAGAPQTAAVATADQWQHSYSRSTAIYPSEFSRANKYWPPVGRLDNVYGDRNLVCSCPSIKDYQ